MRRQRVNLTRGIWHYDSSLASIVNEEGTVICLVQNLSELDPEDFPESEFKGNMQAICALPELLNSLRNLLGELKEERKEGFYQSPYLKRQAMSLEALLKRLGRKVE